MDEKVSEEQVMAYLTQEGLEGSKTKKKRLLSMTPVAFSSFLLNTSIGKFCKVLLSKIRRLL
jgi:hypothetical protein